MKNCMSAPLDVFIAVTNRCNLACKHCNVYPTRHSTCDLTTAEWIKFIRRLAELKVFTLWISGGEPFMRDDIFSILDEIEKHHFHYGLNTNATLIDESGSQRISTLKKLYSIVVSLDGSNADIHEAQRGKGSFDRTIRGIETLLKYSKHVSTYTTVTRNNCHDIENIVILGKELGLAAVKFNELLPLGNAVCHLPNLTLSNSQRRAVTNETERLRDIYGGFVIGTILEMGSFFRKFAELDNTNNKYADVVNGLFGCGGGSKKCTIRPDGWVVPCDRLWDLKAGHILETDFQEIWNSSPVFADMRKRASVSLDAIDGCDGCGYKSLCIGGCPAVSYELTGSVFKVDPMSCYKIYKGNGYPYMLHAMDTPKHHGGMRT
ncbi:MAG TPA: radical SAM protein [Syntrophales bacterium]|nr:radical SAM protein [Syntrophales bacterium]